MAYKQISPQVVAEGGTGVTSITDHAIIVGSGTGAITEIGPLTNGQLAIGSTGADPVASTLTEGTGMSITNGAGSITFSVSGGGFDWNEVTGTSQSAAVNNGYICNNAGLVTVTLPSTAALGSIIKVVGKGAGGWKIAQSALQTIYNVADSTTTGTGGFLSSTSRYDAVELLCITANTDFVIISGRGNPTPT